MATRVYLMPRAIIAAAAAWTFACATAAPVGGRAREVPESARRPAAPEPARGARERVLATARGLVGRTKIQVGGRRFGSDCTGLVRAAFAPEGIDLLRHAEPGDNGVTAIWRFASTRGRLYRGGWPVAGDLVFFRETYDQNRDGRINDGLTHVGLVDGVAGDGTITVIHRVSRGVVRYQMNLRHPHQHREPASGKVWNDYLREPGSSRQVLTGELFASYATLL